jgi:uncharacterized protein
MKQLLMPKPLPYESWLTGWSMVKLPLLGHHRLRYIMLRQKLLSQGVYMSIAQLLHEKRNEIEQIAARHGVIRVRIFGSVARDEATPMSDIDLLVETGPVTSAWFPAGLMLDLEALLGRPIDIVTERALHPELREAVLRDARPL